MHPGGEGRFFDEYAEVIRNGTRMPNSTYDGEFYMFGGQRWGFRINGTGEPRIEIGSGAGRTKLRFPQ